MTADRAAGSGMPAVEVTDLTKIYGQTAVVDQLSLSVSEGEIFGVLGPNGAGKTTAVECVMGLRRPDKGSIRVMGIDPVTQRHAAEGAIQGTFPPTSPLLVMAAYAVVFGLCAWRFFRWSKQRADWERADVPGPVARKGNVNADDHRSPIRYHERRRCPCTEGRPRAQLHRRPGPTPRTKLVRLSAR